MLCSTLEIFFTKGTATLSLFTYLPARQTGRCFTPTPTILGTGAHSWAAFNDSKPASFLSCSISSSANSKDRSTRGRQASIHQQFRAEHPTQYARTTAGCYANS